MLVDDTESANHTLRGNAPSPAGETTLHLEVEASSQAPDNPSTYYICEVGLLEG